MGEYQGLKVRSVEVEDSRNAFLEFLYKEQIIQANVLSLQLADKLFSYNFLSRKAPEFAMKTLPKSIGISVLAKLYAGHVLQPTVKNIEYALSQSFPDGFLMKPVSEMNSDGTSLVFDSKKIAVKILEEIADSQPPFKSSILGQLVSGEEWMVQALVPMGKACEYRVHTMGHRVVRGGTSCRWDHFYDEKKFAEVDDCLQLEMDKIPKGLLQGHAWGIDVFYNGKDLKIVDINTNRGQAVQWSGDMSVPDVLGAYVRHVEEFFGYYFLGHTGESLRSGNAGMDSWYRKFGKEKVEEYLALKRQASLS